MYNRLAYIVKNMKKLTPRRLLILPYLHERKIYMNKRHDADQFYTIIEHEERTYILCLCINDDEMYIYTETGILCEKIIYPDLREKCGKPVAVSEDGKTMLFRKCKNSFIVNVIQITINGPKFWFKIDIRARIKNYLFNMKTEQVSHPFERTENFLEAQLKFFKNYLGSLEDMKKVTVSYTMNDNGDILIRMKPDINKGTETEIDEFKD